MMIHRAIIRPIEQAHVGATKRAGVWLGVKAPVERIFVFRFASRAHREDPHGRLFTIIRDILHDGEAGAAVGAVDEGIAIAPIGRVEQFTKAVVTGRTIRRDERLALDSFLTVCDDEAVLMADRYEFRCDIIDARQWRGLLA
jgi:hypothetical protein